MNISVSTQPPASAKRPAVIIGGCPHRPQDKAPDGQQAAAHLRQALYSGRIPPADWSAAEQALRIAHRARIGAGGGAGGGGASKRRGGAAWYKWVTACRVAKRAGLPAPPKPAARAGKAKPR